MSASQYERELKNILEGEEKILSKITKTCSILEKDNYCVETFTRGSIALEELGKKHFDIIVTDIKMGKIDGIDILETASEKYPDTKVIIISGLSKIEIVNKAFQKGAFDYLVKPFKSEELKKIIRKAEIELIEDRTAKKSQ